MAEALRVKDEVLTAGGQPRGKGAGNVASGVEELFVPSTGEGLGAAHGAGKRRPRKRQHEGLIAGDERLAAVG